MSVLLPVATRPAGFWVRLVAFLLDVFVIIIAQFLLGRLAALRWGADVDGVTRFSGGVAFFTLVFAVVYPAALHAIAGQTLGKLVMGVRVVGVDGALLPLGAALLRAVVSLLALVFAFGLGHVIGGLRKDKRALHDLLAGSRVEHLPRVVPVPDAPPPPGEPIVYEPPPPEAPAPAPPTTDWPTRPLP
jgi:uncharacterized RDD family membrane protein YckC